MLSVILLLQYPSKQTKLKQQKNLLHHWIITFGPPIYLVTDRGSEYVNKEMALLCTLLGIRESPRTSYSPWPCRITEQKSWNSLTNVPS